MYPWAGVSVLEHQGGCSLALRVAGHHHHYYANVDADHDHDHDDDADYDGTAIDASETIVVIQFRPHRFTLDIDTAGAGSRTYGELAPRTADRNCLAVDDEGDGDGDEAAMLRALVATARDARGLLWNGFSWDDERIDWGITRCSTRRDGLPLRILNEGRVFAARCSRL